MKCWWHQWRISRAADDQREIPAGTQRHMGHCADCRVFAAQVQRMGEVLSDEAGPVARIAPGQGVGLGAGLHTRFAARGVIIGGGIAAAAAAVVVMVMSITAMYRKPDLGMMAALSDRPSLAMLVTQSANAVQTPMQRQVQWVVAEVSNAAQVLVPPWPTPVESADGTGMP